MTLSGEPGVHVLLREMPKHRYAVRLRGEVLGVDHRSVWDCLGYSGTGRPRLKYGYHKMTTLVRHEEQLYVERLGGGSFSNEVSKLIRESMARDENPFG